MSVQKNIQIVSFWFFLVSGFAQLILGLLIFKGDYNSDLSQLFRILDIPFIFSAVTYLFATLSIKSNADNLKKNLYLILTILFFILVLFVNLYFPDLPLPITYGT